MTAELVLIQKILLFILLCISAYFLWKRIVFKESKSYVDWQFPMLLALFIDVCL